MKQAKFKEAIKKEVVLMYHHKRLIISVLSVILLLMLYFFKDATTPLRSITFIGVLIFFYAIDRLFNVEFELKHYIIVIIIDVIAVLMSQFYFIHPNYDKFQHLIFPMLLSSIVIYMINKLNLAFKWKIVFTLTVTISILGLFEIGEYLLDSLFDLKLQGVYLRDIQGLEKFNILLEPIDDTMIDLAFGIAGSSLYAMCTYLRYKFQNC